MLKKLYLIFLGNVFGAVAFMIWLYLGPYFLKEVLSLGAWLSGAMYFLMIFVCVLFAVFPNIANYRKKHRGSMSCAKYMVAALAPYVIVGIRYILFLTGITGGS